MVENGMWKEGRGGRKKMKGWRGDGEPHRREGSAEGGNIEGRISGVNVGGWKGGRYGQRTGRKKEGGETEQWRVWEPVEVRFWSRKQGGSEFLRNMCVERRNRKKSAVYACFVVYACFTSPIHLHLFWVVRYKADAWTLFTVASLPLGNVPPWSHQDCNGNTIYKLSHYAPPSFICLCLASWKMGWVGRSFEVLRHWDTWVVIFLLAYISICLYFCFISQAFLAVAAPSDGSSRGTKVWWLRYSGERM